MKNFKQVIIATLLFFAAFAIDLTFFMGGEDHWHLLIYLPAAILFIYSIYLEQTNRL